MAIDYALIARAGGLSKGIPGVVLKERKDAKKDELEQAWKDAIDKRDGMVSRVSGKPIFTQGGQKVLRDHCHLFSKKAHPEWRYEVWNGFNATRYEHKLIHSGWIVVEGTDANKRLIFRWADFVKLSDRTFRILSKRRSQNK